MFFAAPIWLLGLIPWGVVAVVLLVSRRPRMDVPFLDLWTLNAPQDSVRRSYATPPPGVILALLAALLAIVAAAGPAVRTGGVGPLVVVVDVGVEMSIGAAQFPGALSDAVGRQPARFVEAAGRLQAILEQAGASSVPLEVHVVPAPTHDRSPAPVRVQGAELRSRLAAWSLSAVGTDEAIDRLVRQQLSDPRARVLVLTDRPLPAASSAEGLERVRVLSPPGPPGDNTGIVRLSVRRTPSPQAMIRVRRDVVTAGTALSSRGMVVRLTTGDRVQSEVVELAPGAVRDLFIDLPDVGAVVTAELAGSPSATSPSPPESRPYADAYSADDRVDLVVEADWPVIEPAVVVDELQRLIDLYVRTRPAGERSVPVRLVATPAELGSTSGVIMAAMAGVSITATRATNIADHPSLAEMDLSRVDLPAAIDRVLPPGAWAVVLSDAAGPLLAVRQSDDVSGGSSVRQAWTAVDPRGWGGQVAYVVFWSGLLDWVGFGADGNRWASHPVESLSPEWTPVERAPGGDTAVFWPGIYQRSDGVRRSFGPVRRAEIAVRPPAEGVTPGIAGPGPSRSSADDEQVAQWLRSGRREVPLSPWAVVVSLALLAGAASVWRRAASIRRSKPATLVSTAADPTAERP